MNEESKDLETARPLWRVAYVYVRKNGGPLRYAAEIVEARGIEEAEAKARAKIAALGVSYRIKNTEPW